MLSFPYHLKFTDRDMSLSCFTAATRGRPLPEPSLEEPGLYRVLARGSCVALGIKFALPLQKPRLLAASF